MISLFVLSAVLFNSELSSWAVINQGKHVALVTYGAADRHTSWTIQPVVGPTQVFFNAGESPKEELLNIVSVRGYRITLDLARIGNQSILASDYHGGATRGIVLGYFDEDILPIVGPCPSPFKTKRIQSVRISVTQGSPKGLRQGELVRDVYSPRLIGHGGQPWLIASGYTIGGSSAFCWVTNLNDFNSGIDAAAYIGEGEDPEVAVMHSGEVVVALKAPVSGSLVRTPIGGSMFEANNYRKIRFFSSTDLVKWNGAIEPPEGIGWIDFDIVAIDRTLWLGGTIRSEDTFAATILSYEPSLGWAEHLFEFLEISEEEAASVALAPLGGVPSLLVRSNGRFSVLSVQ